MTLDAQNSKNIQVFFLKRFSHIVFITFKSYSLFIIFKKGKIENNTKQAIHSFYVPKRILYEDK